MDIPSSNRGIWHIISGRSSLQEPNQIADILQQNKQRLLDGVLWYKKPSASASQKLTKAENIKPKRKELVKKLSKILDLDEWQSLGILSNYLANEFRGSMQQLLVSLVLV
ncbi:nucleoporin NUP188 homolog [Exaiptasia diaphana]|uniref:Nucleoporin Nup188 N-terminal domain-containing protein n=1 Tax=Exaiptasia diaphana TaxID=2652724 RepID=A0A913WUT7_EXADI|nr:nucleoporin NUP188 homolog [Exaiptasia diaphana]KXJ06319.1 Nucleoporin NUP188-like [Exaiptasia diaphana]